MPKSLLIAFSILLSLLTSSVGQIPSRREPQKSTSLNDEVVRINTNLVQVDAVVTDGHGKQVTDLHPEDFEILEDQQARQITVFSYVSTVTHGPTSPRTKPSAPTVKNAPPVPINLNRDQVGRTIALIVDDLGMSMPSMGLVRPALKRFVDEQMESGDLVAILPTSGGLWQPTGDKRVLHGVIDRLRWSAFRNRVGVTALPAYTNNLLADGSPGSSVEENVFARTLYGTIATLQYVIRGLKVLPGRKSLIFFTDHFPLDTSEGGPGDALIPDAVHGLNSSASDLVYPNLLERLIQASNRASVVIHAIDMRGLQTTSPQARDSSPTDNPNRTGSMAALASGEWLIGILNDRSGLILGTQQGLRNLADGTGGFAVINNNDPGKGINRIMEDLEGYYLIGYRPSDKTFEKRTKRVPYHQITVRLKRPDLHVRSRKGFYGVPDEGKPAVLPRTMVEQMIAAIDSPFSSGGVHLRLTTLFGNGQPGSFVHVLIHVDARDLTFIEQPDGWHQTVMDVLASSYELNGRIADHMARTDTVRARGKTYERLLRNGLDYDLVVAVKNSGSFQMRAAIRDAATGHMGAAFQFVEIPDLKKNRLALSGITLSDPGIIPDPVATFWTTAVQPVATLKISKGLGPGEEPDIQPTAAVRRFQRGAAVLCRFSIYNARPDPHSTLPQLTAQVRLFREGQLIRSDDISAVDTSVLQFDPRRLAAKATLRLSDDLQPGDYVLQIVVTDPLAGKSSNAASQWIDFEIVR